MNFFVTFSVDRHSHAHTHTKKEQFYLKLLSSCLIRGFDSGGGRGEREEDDKKNIFYLLKECINGSKNHVTLKMAYDDYDDSKTTTA